MRRCMTVRKAGINCNRCSEELVPDCGRESEGQVLDCGRESEGQVPDCDRKSQELVPTVIEIQKGRYRSGGSLR